MAATATSTTSAAVRVAILDDYQQVALTIADWSPLKDRVTVDVFTDTIAEEDALVKRLLGYQIICAMRERTKFTRSLLDRLPDLRLAGNYQLRHSICLWQVRRLIATTGPFNAGIDVAHAKSKGIVVVGTGGQGNSTLEHIWALILATARYVAIDDGRVKAGKEPWQAHVPLGLSGRTLGLVGVGRFGSQTAKVSSIYTRPLELLAEREAKIAKAFNMKVIGWSPNLTPDRAAAAGVEFAASKEDLLRTSDIVSIHLVLSERTRHIISAADLALMKPTAFFINTSRGPLVDEAALVEVLRNKKIAGAGLDVFDVEPLPLDHPLRRLENVTLTPHTGYVNDSNYEVSSSNGSMSRPNSPTSYFSSSS